MRLIDADALNEEIANTTTFIMDSVMFQKMVAEAPTVEAVPQKWIDEQLQNYIIEHADLVTCKDCINYNDQNGFCHYYLKPEDKDGYCSHGERREE